MPSKFKTVYLFPFSGLQYLRILLFYSQSCTTGISVRIFSCLGSVVFSNLEFKFSKKVLFIYTIYTMDCLSVCWMACQSPQFTFARHNLYTVLFAKRPFCIHSSLPVS